MKRLTQPAPQKSKLLSFKEKHLSILGAGIAGLSSGYYARRHHIPFAIYEAADGAGGNAITLCHGDFFFDSGAHRFHGEAPEATTDIKSLMGEGFRKIEVPSYICLRGKMLDFPLSPLNLLIKLGFRTFARASLEVLGSRLEPWNGNGNFRDFALHSYGKTIAHLVLLNYSEKLWGMAPEDLAPAAAGKRLKGLSLKTFLIESVLGSRAKTQHLDGSFYYPEGGIGMIAKRLADFCGKERIFLNSRITKVLRDERRILALEVNGQDIVKADWVVSSLPLSLFIRSLEPPPPQRILDLARTLRFRDVKLVTFFLNKASVMKAATIYFPDLEYPFTRVYEPKNRDATLSPPEKTSVVAEIPFHEGDETRAGDDRRLIQQVSSNLTALGWFREEEILGTAVHTVSAAYPVFSLGFEEKVEKIMAYLRRFSNLRLCGRNATFSYAWIHSLVRQTKELIEKDILNA